jgi:zinc protease
MTPLYSDIAAIKKTINTPDKENGVYLARLDVPINEDDVDYAALLVANYLVGGGAGLDSRLMVRVRQKEGLSYGVNSQLSINAINRDGRFTISATAAPQNMAKVEAAIAAELQRIVTEGFSASEVAGAQSGIAQQRLQGRTRDSNLAGGWVQNLYLQKTFKRSEELDAKIAQLTAAEVSAAFAKYIRPDKLTVVIAMDEAKAAKTP